MMATMILDLPTYSSGAKLPAEAWNGMAWAADGLARVIARAGARGVISGWEMASGVGRVSAGSGVVGALYCVTATSQAISGLVANATNYIHARASANGAGAGAVEFVARTTSGWLTNPDGVTLATRLGSVVTSGAAVREVNNSGSAHFPRDQLLRFEGQGFVLPNGTALLAAGAGATLTGGLRLGGELALAGPVRVGGTSGASGTLQLPDKLRYSGAVLQYRTREIEVNNGIVTSLSTTGAWTAVPTG